MPPTVPTKPESKIGDPSDSADAELVHARTLSPGVEEYHLVSPSVFQRVSVRSDAELAAAATRMKAKKVKKGHKPGAERYARIDNEPIRVD